MKAENAARYAKQYTEQAEAWMRRAAAARKTMHAAPRESELREVARIEWYRAEKVVNKYFALRQRAVTYGRCLAVRGAR